MWINVRSTHFCLLFMYLFYQAIEKKGMKYLRVSMHKII